MLGQGKIVQEVNFRATERIGFILFCLETEYTGQGARMAYPEEYPASEAAKPEWALLAAMQAAS